MPDQKTDLAVLFADVSDSTRLYESLGDAIAFDTVKGVLALLAGITEALLGRVVKTMGDGVMCVFPTADSAAAAASDMQSAVAGLPPIEGDRKLTIRIGYHFGHVLQVGEDVYGDSVNVAARVAGLAFAGQILTTGETESRLHGVVRNSMRRLDTLPVKGKAAGIDVYEQLWQDDLGSATIARGALPVAPPIRRQIRLVHHGRELALGTVLEFGREPAEGLVTVLGPMISRRHAKIERRGNKFVLTDRSSNGTFVTLGNSPEILLRREELTLHGAGLISFGQSATEPGAEIVEFHCS